VVSRKIAGGCTLKSDNSIIDKCQDLINTNTLKSKAEKSKDNKLAHESNETNMKRSKCQGKNAKTINKDIADVCNMQNKENAKTCEQFDNIRDNAKEKENASPSEKSKKYNAKEAKEKRNKEDTRNKNRGNGGTDLGENKETAVPFARNKEQLFDQVYALMQSVGVIYPMITVQCVSIRHRQIVFSVDFTFLILFHIILSYRKARLLHFAIKRMASVFLSHFVFILH